MVRIQTQIKWGKTVRIAPKNLYNVMWWRNQNHISQHVIGADSNAKAVAAATRKWSLAARRASLGDNTCVVLFQPRANLIVSRGRPIPKGVTVDLIA